MEDIDIVKEVTHPRFKTGVSKTGKEWVMHKISLNSGKTANCFDDVTPGDTVKLTYNEEYKTYTAAKPRKSDGQHDEVVALLKEILRVVKGTDEIGPPKKEEDW